MPLSALRQAPRRRPLVGLPRLLKASSFYTNSFYLMGATVASTFFGVLFWTVAARVSSPHDIGIATATIAGAGLLITLCDFGLGATLIQFAGSPESDGIRLINATVRIGWLLSFVAGTVFVLSLPLWSRNMAALRDDPLLSGGFVCFVVANYLLTLQDAAMLSRRRASYVFWRTLACNGPSVLLLLPVAAALGEGRAPFLAFALPNIVVMAAAGLVLLPRVLAGYRFFGRMDRSPLRDLSSYALSIHSANVLWAATTFVLPLIAIGTLTAAETAFFSINWMVLNFVLIIPRTVGSALFVEGAHDVDRSLSLATRALGLILALAIPLVLILWFLGPRLTSIFGSEYVNPTLLRVLLLSVVPFAVNSLFFMVIRLQRRLVLGIAFSAAVAVMIIALSVLLALRFELDGLAWGWLLGQVIVMLGVVVFVLSGSMTRGIPGDADARAH